MKTIMLLICAILMLSGCSQPEFVYQFNEEANGGTASCTRSSTYTSFNNCTAKLTKILEKDVCNIRKLIPVSRTKRAVNYRFICSVNRKGR